MVPKIQQLATLLRTYTTGFYGEFFCTQLFDCYDVERDTDENKSLHLRIFDIQKEDEYPPVRSKFYPETDIFLILFSIISPESLNNIVSKWHPKIRHQCPNTPIGLVGTKLDLRDNHDETERLTQQSMKPVSYEQGLKVANEIGAVFYCECSASTQKGVSCIFDEAITIADTNPNSVEPMARIACSVM